MSKLKIKLMTLGHLPIEFDKKKVKKHKSNSFELVGEIENYTLNTDSDGFEWEFSDDILMDELPKEFEGDFLIALSNIPLEDNYYTRRIGENKIIFTFHEVKEYLQLQNIPLENMVYRLLYGYSLIYKRSGNRIPEIQEMTNFTHDETRGCLFDMNGIKSEIVHSCVKPKICDDCSSRLRKEKVSDDFIKIIKGEISKIHKPLFYQITDYIKSYPILSIFFSSIIALIIGTIGSILASIIFKNF